MHSSFWAHLGPSLVYHCKDSCFVAFVGDPGFGTVSGVSGSGFGTKARKRPAP